MSLEALLMGRLLLERYRVDALLGRGGMGVVYRATDMRLGREVAVKVLAEPSLDPGSRARARARFQREAMESARLHHPNVVRIYDFGTDAAHDLDLLVMELLRGQDLAGWMKSGNAPPLPTALAMLAQAARGLGAGHALGLVHRDVKPGNLFVSGPPDRPAVHVLDFGIVEMMNPEGTITQLTQFGFTPHSLRYASPEQLRGGVALSPSSDVCSLAITGFELLTGESAFTDGSIPDRERAADMLGRRLAAHSVPAAVIEVMARALDSRPPSRFTDADAFANALESVAVPRSTVGTAHLPPPLPPTDRVAPVPVQASSGSGWSVVAASVGVAVVGVAVVAMMSIRSPEDEVTQSAASGTPASTLLSTATDSAAMPPATTDIASVIEAIRSDFQRIEAIAPQLSKREITLEGFSTEGGVAEIYENGSEVEKVAVAHYGEMGKTLEDLYFRDGALIFAFRRTYSYDRPFGEVQQKEENRFYFDGGRLVRWRGPDQQLISSSNPSYASEEADLLSTANTLISAARSGAASLSR